MPPNPSGDAATPTREEVIQLLDKEIDDVRDEMHRPGWSQWAITGSLAGLIWLFTEQIQKEPFSLVAVSLSALVGFLGLESLNALFLSAGLLGVEWKSIPRSRYFSIRKAIHDYPRALLNLVLLCALIAVAIWQRGGVSRLAFCLTVFTLGAEMISEAGAFILSFRSMPIAPTFLADRPRWWGFAVLVRIALTAYAAVGYSRHLWYLGVTPVDIQFSMLVAAVCYLVGLYLERPPKAPLLGELIELRRGLTLHRIGVSECCRQFETLLYGARVEDFFQEQIQQINSQQKTAAELCLLVEADFQALGTGPIVVTPSSAFLERLSQTRTSAALARKSLERLASNTIWADLLAPGVKSELEQATTNIRAALGDVSSRLQILEEKISLKSFLVKGDS